MQDFHTEMGQEASDKFGVGELNGAFKVGAEWGHKWSSDKGVNYLAKWMKSVKYKRTAKLEAVVRFAAGLISTMPEHSSKHPEDVEQWIYDEFKKASQS